MFAQTATAPVVTAVVNSASYSIPVLPGSLISIFGSNLAGVTQSAAASVTPLPTILGGTSVSVNDVPAPLLFVSPGQINAQMPFPGVGFPAVSASIVISGPGGVSQSSTFPISYAAAALFSSDSSGCGQAAALNIRADGTGSVNSTTNSAAPGDYLALYGTGLGILQFPPADGTAATGADRLSSGLGVSLGDAATAAYLGNPAETAELEPAYAGAAPGLVGVGQVNVQIPMNTRNGCSVPISVDASGQLLSPTVTVSVNAGRGQCADPPQQSYGQVTMTKTIASGTSSDGEIDTLQATFPSGPGLVQPPVTPLTPGANYFNDAAPGLSARACAVSGYSFLSAGTIQIQTAGQSAISADPVNSATGMAYQSTLPAGYIQPGQYTISTSSGVPVAFQESMTVAHPITIQTSLTPGTVISASNPPTITWTGGDASSVVRLTLVSDSDSTGTQFDVYYVSAAAGSVKLQSVCTAQEPLAPSVCGFGLPLSNRGEIVIEVLPPDGVADSIPAQGISQQVRFSWNYRYVFGGLSLTN